MICSSEWKGYREREGGREGKGGERGKGEERREDTERAREKENISETSWKNVLVGSAAVGTRSSPRGDLSGDERMRERAHSPAWFKHTFFFFFF